MEKIKLFINDTTAILGPGFGKYIGAILIILIGWIVASIVKKVIVNIFKRTQLDERMADKMHLKMNLGKFIAKLAYYLILLYALIMSLETLGMTTALDPVKNLFTQIGNYIPNIIGAAIIGFAGYLIASILSEAVGFVSEGIERLGSRMNLSANVSLTNIVKKIVFIIIFIPLLVQALDYLKMDAISEPAKEMFNTLLNSLPNILAAGIILAVFYFVGRYVVELVVGLLRSMGTDGYAETLGLSKMIGEGRSISQLLGNIAFFFIMFTGIIAAVDKLELEQVSDILTVIFAMTGKIFMGLLILILGNFIAGMVANALKGSNNQWVVSIARYGIIALFLAMGLNTMGVGSDIVNLAFGLTLGAIAVAVALAFGLGGREAAGRHFEHIMQKIRGEK